MKKTLNLIKPLSILFVLTATVQLLSFSVFADNEWNPFSENKEREQLVLEALDNGTELPPENDDIELPTPSTRWLCLDCSWFMPSVCAADAIIHNTYTHEYGVFTKGTCKVTDLYSSAAYVCPTCGRVDFIDGQHWCWEHHQTCDQGNIDMCRMEVS